MSRLKKLILKEGHEAYVSLFVAFIAVFLMWSVKFNFFIQLKVGDQVNTNWLVFLNSYANWYWLFITIAILCGLIALGFATHSWKKVLIIASLTVIIGFCGVLAFVMGIGGTTYIYDVSASIEYANKNNKIIHARREGDAIVEADYLLLQCDISGSDCKITDQFEDYHSYGNKSKPVSFYVEPSDNALYIKVGDASKLVSKT